MLSCWQMIMSLLPVNAKFKGVCGLKFTWFEYQEPWVNLSVLHAENKFSITLSEYNLTFSNMDNILSANTVEVFIDYFEYIDYWRISILSYFYNPVSTRTMNCFINETHIVIPSVTKLVNMIKRFFF